MGRAHFPQAKAHVSLKSLDSPSLPPNTSSPPGVPAVAAPSRGPGGCGAADGHAGAVVGPAAGATAGAAGAAVVLVLPADSSAGAAPPACRMSVVPSPDRTTAT